MQTRIEVGILGATGMVGQHFIKFLQGHPWFDLKWLGASDRSAGKKYKDAMTWHLPGGVPATVADLTVEDCQPGNAPRLLFSAMDASVATEIERAFAQAGHIVVSNSKNHRMERDVPLLVPEINPDHLKLVPGQQRARGWKGQIVTNPNCSTVGLTMGLGPLKPFGITQGDRHHHAGHLRRGLSRRGFDGHRGQRDSVHRRRRRKDAAGNAEDPGRVSRRSHRAAGRQGERPLQPRGGGRRPHRNRLGGVFVETLRSRTCAAPSTGFTGVPQERKLPSAPPAPVIYLEESNRPQPRKDAERERGMAAFVGRLRPCPVLDWKFVVLSHNTIRGAAGAAVLNAELMHSEGMLD